MGYCLPGKMMMQHSLHLYQCVTHLNCLSQYLLFPPDTPRNMGREKETLEADSSERYILVVKPFLTSVFLIGTVSGKWEEFPTFNIHGYLPWTFESWFLVFIWSLPYSFTSYDSINVTSAHLTLTIPSCSVGHSEKQGKRK